jgi:hypothetical protein
MRQNELQSGRMQLDSTDVQNWGVQVESGCARLSSKEYGTAS